MKRILLLILVQCCLLTGISLFADPQNQSITLPAGTVIAIRTIDRIDSKKADLRREYAASLDDPVVVNGVTVVPANANAFLRLTDVKNPKLKRASLATSLIAVTINGQRVEVNTDKVDSQSGSKTKRTLVGSAAGAGAGAAIGSIGGPVGAGVGAGLGAAAGGLAGRMTGKGVEIAPETRFTYTLTQPVAIDYQSSEPVTSDRPAPMQPIEPAPPPDTPAGTVRPGMTIDEVKGVLGQPKTIIDLGDTKKYIYPQLKITFKNGKVTDIE